MKKTFLIFTLTVIIAAINASCLKKRKYNDGYRGDRVYSLVFDHVEVVNETETANVNGKLDVLEKATLNVYLKNEGPDPCLINYGIFDRVVVPESEGFYITNVLINEVVFGDPNAEGKKIQYIDPGEMDYIALNVRTYEYLDTNQDVQLYLDLIDYDGDTTHLDFPIHIE